MITSDNRDDPSLVPFLLSLLEYWQIQIRKYQLLHHKYRKHNHTLDDRLRGNFLSVFTLAFCIIQSNIGSTGDSYPSRSTWLLIYINISVMLPQAHSSRLQLQPQMLVTPMKYRKVCFLSAPLHYQCCPLWQVMCHIL